MFLRNTLVRGTLILTAAGLASRFAGFFFRIFLSRAFGEEQVGLYQLVFPAYALCCALAMSGIQTALSRIVARRTALGREDEAKLALCLALVSVLSIASLELLFVQQNSGYIAETFLGDIRCRDLLLIFSYALPCSAIHSCICGYSFGLRQTKIPAISQLVEQGTRILSVMLLFFLFSTNGRTPSIHIAAAGIVIGELCAALYSSRALSRKTVRSVRPTITAIQKQAAELFTLSLPLTANRTAITLLQSIEAASIPACLRLGGLSVSESLRLYGVFTGMALPCILFPSAITGSVGTMLMPAVTTAQTSGDRRNLIQLVRKASGTCFLLGLCCCFFFLVTGNLLGSFLFHSRTAGNFILTLSWICPFLYTNSALLSAINGLGRTGYTFFINTSGLLIRICGVFLAIPRFGMYGYLISLLISQGVVFLISVPFLYRSTVSKMPKTRTT